MFISIQNLSKKFTNKTGNEIIALKDVNLSIKKGEFVALLGLSGCGKTTLMNIIAGFEKYSEGIILIDGKNVLKPKSEYVTIFQNYGLLPWRSVEKNIELGLEAKKMPKNKRKEIVEKYMEMVGLTKFKNHHPHQLSGGMQQRVSIARALAVEPEILFMDEPFGALDTMTRTKMQEHIKKIWVEKKPTIVFVTHDIEEAVFLSQKVVIMTPGPGKINRILEVDLPTDRKRNSLEFQKYRDIVLDEFERTFKNFIRIDKID
jgi:NitT/TauT family transport system ATP-binding protein